MYLKLFCFLIFYPGFHQCSSKTTEIEFKIKEEVPKNTVVGNLSQFFSKDNDGFIFKFSMEDNEYAELFQINNTSDKLLTVQRIDREALCDSEIFECELHMKLVMISSSNKFVDIYPLKITVVDINDNAPYFESAVMSREIDESLNLNSIIHLKGAHDLDAGVNTVKFYELISEYNNTFALQFEKSGLLDGLVLKRQLDREKKDFYKLTLIAKDNGNPQKSGSVTINLTVRDVNDNKPLFTNDSYNVYIYENTSISSVILTLTAKDADSAQNGQVGYKFPYNVKQSVKKIFSIDENSGEITLKSNIDYEKKSKYSFKVVAFDYGFQPMTSIVSVNVNILNINDNQPDIFILHVSDNVSESDKIGATIARISVSDKDDGDQRNPINCSLSNSYFTLNSDLDEIKIAQSLDFEKFPVQNVSILCHDNGKPPLQSIKSFLVYVHDVNDNPPVFENPILVSQPENNDFQAFQVVATDRDSGSNGEFYYKLLNGSVSSLFSINNQTGYITTDVKFDREKNSELEFNVQAIDLGNPALTGTGTIILHIVDVNDETPTFAKSYYEFHVKEGQASSTVVGKVEGQDLDIKENGRLFYWIPSDNESSEYFYVRHGILKTKKTLTYSRNLKYDFTVFTSDHGTPPLSSWTNVTVFVDDINDHVPYFNYPTVNNNTISILYDMMGTNALVAKVNARDDDYDENAQLSYFLIKPPNSPDIFRMNHSSGEIRLIKKKNIKVQKNAIKLKIVVQDRGKPKLQNSSILFVKVDFANESSYLNNIDNPTDKQYRKIGIILGIVTACLFVCVVIVVCVVRKIDNNRRRYPAKKLEDVALKKSLKKNDQPRVSINIPNNSETTDDCHLQLQEKTESKSSEYIEGEMEIDESLNDTKSEKIKDYQISLQGSCAALL